MPEIFEQRELKDARDNPDKRVDEKDFDWSVLWADQEEGGLMKFLPIVSLVLNFIILIVLFTKKWKSLCVCLSGTASSFG